MKKYLYLILFFLVCVPAIAGTINSYTLKSPPDDADTIVIYDSDDGSTKKAQIGDISGSSSSGINWTAYTDLTALGNANEFIVNDSGTSKSINWEVFQTQLPSGTASGWTEGGTNVYLTTSTDNIGIGTHTPTARVQLVGTGESNSININKFWNMFHSLVGFGGSSELDYFWLHPSPADTSMRLALMGNGTIGGTANSLIAGIKIFSTTNITDLTNSCDYGMYMTSSGMRFNTKSNGTCPTFPVNWGRQDSTIDMTLSAGNLGIGTTTPTERLHVATGSDQTLLITSTATGTSGGAVLKVQQDSGAVVGANSRVGGIQAVGATDTSHTIGVGASVDFIAGSAYSGSNLETDMRIRLVPSGSTTLAETSRFKSDGSLGIGTVSPRQKLEVAGTIRATSFMSSDGSAGVTGSSCTAWKNGLCTSL